MTYDTSKQPLNIENDIDGPLGLLFSPMKLSKTTKNRSNLNKPLVGKIRNFHVNFKKEYDPPKTSIALVKPYAIKGDSPVMRFQENIRQRTNIKIVKSSIHQAKNK